MNPAPLLLEMRGIRKGFPGVQALEEVSLELRPGEVLALLGENGAGKSTLMKILGGIHAPDDGEILLDGAPASIDGVASARALGIRLIHQELMLCPNLDVAANIYLGDEEGSGSPWRRLPRRKLAAEARVWMERVGLAVPPGRLVKSLSPGQMQMVEIAKALAGRARIIVMDEPTSSLTLTETELLFKIIGDLRAAGMGIIYISHRLEEIFRACDRITVLRDGRRVGDLPVPEATHDKLVSLMVGRELKNWYPERAPVSATPSIPPRIEVEGLVVPGTKSPVNFSVRAGEILGFAGLVGSGRTELMRTLFGVTPAASGRILIDGAPAAIRSPRDAIARGIALVPEDRKLDGLVLPMSVSQNLTLPGIGDYHPWKLLQRKKEREVAGRQTRELNVKTPSLAQRVVNLSGGNQQKVVIGKWLALEPRVLILDEPTRGIDVGAKAEIYRQMAELARRGLAIVMVSSDLEEVLGMSDRVAVMHDRRLAGILERGSLSEENIMKLAVGKAPEAGQEAA